MPTQVLEPTKKQWQAIQAIRSKQYRYILTGGAMSTAKSYGLALIFLSMAKQFPGTRYGIFRRYESVIGRTIWQTFIKASLNMGLVEGLDYTKTSSRAAEKVWEFDNGSQIWFMGADETKDPDFNKIKGLELTAAGVDEVNELVQEAYNLINTRVGRENYHGEPQFVLATCNPSDNWVKDVWYTPWVKSELQPPWLFIPSLPEDNPHNSPEYLTALHDMPYQFRKRYVEGNWDYVDDANALFPNRVIDQAITNDLKPALVKRIGVDVAREGTDRIVFALIEGDTLTDLYEPDIDRSDQSPISDLIATELVLYMKRNKVGYQYVTVDAVGNGGGVIDACRRMGYYVQSFKSGERATQLFADGQPKYDMLRSERYWQLAEYMQQGKFKIYSKLANLEELRKDLLAHSYEVKDKATVVESKERMKKRLHRSPDFSDAVVMGWRPGSLTPDDDQPILSGDYAEWFSDEDEW